MRPKGLGQWQIAVSPSGNESATCQLVALYLNQLRQRVHLVLYSGTLHCLYSGTVQWYYTVVLYIACTAPLYSGTVQWYYTVVPYIACTAPLYSGTVEWYCTLPVQWYCTVVLYIACIVVLYSGTIQWYCTVVLYIASIVWISTSQEDTQMWIFKSLLCYCVLKVRNSEKMRNVQVVEMICTMYKVRYFNILCSY